MLRNLADLRGDFVYRTGPHGVSEWPPRTSSQEPARLYGAGGDFVQAPTVGSPHPLPPPAPSLEPLPVRWGALAALSLEFEVISTDNHRPSWYLAGCFTWPMMAAPPPRHFPRTSNDRMHPDATTILTAAA